ncbi:hypothetical protein Tco_0710955 [Tanacetum coccineum]
MGVGGASWIRPGASLRMVGRKQHSEDLPCLRLWRLLGCPQGVTRRRKDHIIRRSWLLQRPGLETCLEAGTLLLRLRVRWVKFPLALSF